MIEKRKRINNPLRLITILIGIPISSMYALKYVKPELQYIFITFIIGYVILLTLLIFRILFIKPEVLYAPSDFKDEQNFFITLKLNKKVERKRNQSKKTLIRKIN